MCFKWFQVVSVSFLQYGRLFVVFFFLSLGCQELFGGFLVVYAGFCWFPPAGLMFSIGFRW